MSLPVLPVLIVIDGTVRRVLHDVSKPNDLRNGYRAIHVAADSVSTVPVEQHHVPATWLLDASDLRKVTTGGHVYEKAVRK